MLAGSRYSRSYLGKELSCQGVPVLLHLRHYAWRLLDLKLKLQNCYWYLSRLQPVNLQWMKIRSLLQHDRIQRIVSEGTQRT